MVIPQRTLHKLYLISCALLTVPNWSKSNIRRFFFRMSKVVVYTAPECPHSKKLKEFLSGIDLEFEEKCVLTSSETLEDLFEVSGQRAIPVTAAEDEIFVGFDRRTERHMKRKLGV